MTELHDAKRALAILAATDTVAHAERAVHDLDQAAAFRASGRVARLRTAIAIADDDHAARGVKL